jgi:hypothetical protein
LTPTIVEHVARAIEWARRFPKAKQRGMLYEREAREEREYEEWAYTLMDDAVPALYGQPFVTVA